MEGKQAETLEDKKGEFEIKRMKQDKHGLKG